MSAFGWLAREALADALRRRIALAVAFAAVLSVVMLESCTPSARSSSRLASSSRVLTAPSSCSSPS